MESLKKWFSEQTKKPWNRVTAYIWVTYWIQDMRYAAIVCGHSSILAPKLMNKMDKNKDGIVSKREFDRYIKSK